MTTLLSDRGTDGFAQSPLPAPFGLWLVALDHAPELDRPILLSTRERDRAARYAFARHRDRYVRAHVALRILLERETGIDRRRIGIVPDALGKPRLEGDPIWRFNMSYAADKVLIGIARGREIGVDIEPVRPIPDALDLADTYFDETERRALAGHDDWYRRSLAFLAGWTRKEACLKLIGAGLRYPARLLPTGLEERHVTVRAQGVPMEVESLRPAPGFVAAWSRCRSGDQ